MAAVANTVLTTQAVGNREELDDFVSMITPTDTPIYSMAGKEKASSKHPEWEYEELDAVADNAQPEGNEYSFDAVTPPTRVGNYTQIFTNTFRFSGSQQAVDNADVQGSIAALHSLLGMSGEAGAQAMYQQVRKLYVPLLEEGEWPSGTTWLPQLQALAVQTEEALRAYCTPETRTDAS